MKPWPTIVLMAGLPGSGKTTLSLELARRLDWISVDKDTLKSALLAGGLNDEVAGPASYQLMQAVAEDLVLRQGRSVILDSPGVYPVTLDLARSLANAAGGSLKVIVLLAARDLRNQRALSRNNLASQPRLPREQDEDDGSSRFVHLPPDRLELDTSAGINDLVERALRYLNQP